MDTRKIQQVGGGTFTVSLPKEWATAAGLEPGSVVSLHTHIDGTLLIRTGERECESTQPLELSVETADPDSVECTLRAAYAAGIETIELRATDTFVGTVSRRVERVVRDLTGVTITEMTGDTIRVRSLLDAEEVSITQSVRQLEFVALSAHRDATAAVSGPTAVEPDDCANRADRIFAMVDRYFQCALDSLSVMDALGLTRTELFVRWVTARELERVADAAGRVATAASRIETPIQDAIVDDFDALAARSRDVVQDAVTLVLDEFDVNTAHTLFGHLDQIRRDIQALDRRLFDSQEADYRLTHALDALRQTAGSADEITALAVRSCLHDESTSSLQIDTTGSVSSPGTGD